MRSFDYPAICNDPHRLRRGRPTQDVIGSKFDRGINSGPVRRCGHHDHGCCAATPAASDRREHHASNRSGPTEQHQIVPSGMNAAPRPFAVMGGVDRPAEATKSPKQRHALPDIDLEQ